MSSLIIRTQIGVPMMEPPTEQRSAVERQLPSATTGTDDRQAGLLIRKAVARRRVTSLKGDYSRTARRWGRGYEGLAITEQRTR